MFVIDGISMWGVEFIKVSVDILKRRGIKLFFVGIFDYNDEVELDELLSKLRESY